MTRPVRYEKKEISFNSFFRFADQLTALEAGAEEIGLVDDKEGLDDVKLQSSPIDSDQQVESMNMPSVAQAFEQILLLTQSTDPELREAQQNLDVKCVKIVEFVLSYTKAQKLGEHVVADNITVDLDADTSNSDG